MSTSGTNGTNGTEHPLAGKHKKAVERILKCKPTAYYSILEVDSKATSDEIKRAYRKIAITVHPDKNTQEGAAEAFKMVSKAFAVLSDDHKRRVYDQTGADPEQARTQAGAGFPGDGGFAGQPFMTPEDIFATFFNNGGTAFSFGDGGFTSFGGFPQGHPRARRRGPPRMNPDPPTGGFKLNFQIILLLATVVLPMILPYITGIFSFLFGIVEDGPSTSGGLQTAYAFQRDAVHDEERLSPKLQVPYYVNKNKYEKLSDKRKEKIESTIDYYYLQSLKRQCDSEYLSKARMIDHYRQFNDDKSVLRYMEAINAKAPSCERYIEMSRKLL